MDLDPARARCFLEVVERGTIAAAAAALGYTPSAVSQQVAKLERSLGTYLFDRVNGRLRPTPAALALVPHVHQVLDALEAGTLAARAASSGPVGAVTVAAFPSAVVNLVAPVAARLPGVLGLVTEAEDDAGLRELALGHVDLAIVQEHSHQRYARDARLHYHRLTDDPFELVVPQEWDLPAVPALPALPSGEAGPTGEADGDRRGREAAGGLVAVGRLPWVVSLPGTPCRASTEEAWRLAGIHPRIAAQASELGSLAALIAGGAGVGLLPRLGIPAGVGGIRIVPGATGIVRTVHAATRRTNSGGAVAEVIAALRAVADGRA